MLSLRPERDEDGPAIEALLDEAFGADRHRKISYRYRSGIPPIRALSFVADEAGRLVGTIRYWPVLLAGMPALLLGPVAIDPGRRAVGIGRALIFETLARATDMGWKLVFLVGDRDYYRRFGFLPVPRTIVMPEEDPDRLQWRGLAGANLPPAGGELLRADGTSIRARGFGPGRPHEGPAARNGARAPLGSAADPAEEAGHGTADEAERKEPAPVWTALEQPC